MAGTIVVDRIESDASYASTINVAGQITFSNTVNFGVFAGTAPVAGFYLPTTNALAFTTASTERMRIDNAGNVGIGTNNPTGDGTALHINASTYAHLHFTNSTTGTTVNDGSDFITVGSDFLIRNRETAAIQFATTGTERMRIDSSGNVGIGTSSPAVKLEVKGAAATAGQLSIHDGTGDTTVSAVTAASLLFQARDTSIRTIAEIDGVHTTTNGTGAAMVFQTRISDTLAERMRIDGSGNLLVGTTTNYGTARTSINNSGTVLGLYCSGASGATGMVIGKASNDASTSQVLMQFLYNNGSSGLGQINGNGGSQAAFGSYSDIRLKENIIDLPSQLDNIMALRPVEFDWKDGTGHQIGFIAQEVNEVYPDVVGIGANEMLTLTDMNKNDARLIKAIQELKALVDTQASTITTLTARITALESN